MSRFGFVFLLALFVLAFAACDGTDSAIRPPDPVPAGAMAYTGYSDSGQAVVTGWIRIDSARLHDRTIPPSALDGAWELRALVAPSLVGPQVGAGTLTVSWLDDQVGVNLNPDHTDNNVTLLGRVTAGGPQKMRYNGRWDWLTIAGVRQSGTFVAAEP